jgi:hypothetical protein
MTRRTTAIRVILLVCSALGSTIEAVAEDQCCSDCVIVEVDLDGSEPGIQTVLTVAAGTRWIRDVTIWIRDPTASAQVHSIGYLGGLNRGLAFGHMPSTPNIGTVEGIAVTAAAPVVSGHDVTINSGIEPLFEGPEIQYFEFGDFGELAGGIPTDPVTPIVSLDIELAAVRAGDVFRFYLGDKTAEWISGQSGNSGGAFSTASLNTLESGGDACPDGTQTSTGVDTDIAAPVPPGLFLVDYRDGGGAEVRIVPGVPMLGHGGRAALGILLAMCALVVAGHRARSHDR